MDYAFDQAENELRARIRALLDEEFPDGFPSIFVDDPRPVEQSIAFCRRLGELGLLTMSWPKEYGGSDASPWAQVVLAEEMWAHNEPRGPQYMGVNWIGPAIRRFGNEKQKREHLSRIARGEVMWCQGFSEPGSGSDLASLRFAARRVDGGWRLNGQKIWTSYGPIADWCFLAARTDTSGPKQHGITIFLIPMDREGISVREIPTTIGPNHLNELFFDDVEATDDDVLGEVDHGWEIITAGLSFERVGVARYARADRLLVRLREELRDEWDELAAPTRQAWLKAIVHARVARLMSYRVVNDRGPGSQAPIRVQASVSRILSSTLDQEVADVLADAAGPRALLDHDEKDALADGDIEHHLRYAPTSTVAAGALEIQKNLIARALL